MTRKDIKAWNNIKKRLKELLTVHNIPKREERLILQTFDQGLVGDNPHTMISCIDTALLWDDSLFSFDYYYFLQLRFACYMCVYSPTEEDKKTAAKYLRSLIYYGSNPYWVNKGLKNEHAKNSDNRISDLTVSKNDYHVRRNFYLEKSKIFAKKFGI